MEHLQELHDALTEFYKVSLFIVNLQGLCMST